MNMEPSEKLDIENPAEEKLQHHINNSEVPEIETHLMKYEDFDFNQFQFKPKKKNPSQATNGDVSVTLITILECPLCGCKSKSLTAKSRHLKECAKKKGIPFAKILEAVELQKKQAEERRLAGLPIITSKPARESRRNAAIKRQLEPETKLQADLQMALAMSLSLQQKQEKEENQERFFLEALTVEPENEDKKLVTALGTGSSSEGKLKAPPGRKNTRKQQGITPFWLVRSKEEIKMIRAERVVKLLSEQDTDSDAENCPFILNWKKIRLHCTVPWPSAGHCRLWEVSSLSEIVRSDLSNFYVKALEHWFPPKKELTSNIQMKNFINTEKKETEEIECLPSTLAALDALQANDSLTQKDETTEAGLDGFILDNTYGDGFFTQAQEEEKVDINVGLRVQMVKRLLGMVNNDALSDVKIVTKNNVVIQCHQFILYINCPAAYLELINNSSDPALIWTDISCEGAITFLQFVYGGIFTGANEKEVQKLATRYKMQNLLDLLSNVPSSHASSDELDHFVEPLSLKNDYTGGLASPVSCDSYSPSPVLTSNIKTIDRSSPVLTSENCNSKPVTRDLEGNSADKSKAIFQHRLVKQSVCFGQSSRMTSSPYVKLSYNGSSMMSPDLFSSVHDHSKRSTVEDCAMDKAVGISSELGVADLTREMPFANFRSPKHNFTPETATSTPMENKLLQSSQKTKTFSISPVLAERPACSQTSPCLEPKHLLGDSKCSKPLCPESKRSCIVYDTPSEAILQNCDGFSQNKSIDKIYKEEESWEKFNYESDDDRPENRLHSIGGSTSSLESLILESPNDDLPDLEDEEVMEQQSTHVKRKLTSTSFKSSFCSKKLRLISTDHLTASSPSKERIRHISENSLDMQMSQLPIDSSPCHDKNLSDADTLDLNINSECEFPVGNDVFSPPKPSLSLSSTCAKSFKTCFGGNSTWNDFPEGYHGCDSLQLVYDPLLDANDTRDLVSPERSSQSSTSQKLSALLSPVMNRNSSRRRSDKCHELLENVLSSGSQNGTWHENLDVHCSNGDSSKCGDDLPDITFSPHAYENGNVEEDRATNYTPVTYSQSSKPRKKMPNKRTKKLNKQLPKEECVTPMPHYSIMETPVIKKELKKIGVRPLPKKKGVTLLKHVYLETHPESTSYASGESPSKPDRHTLKGAASSRLTSEKGLDLDDSYNGACKDNCDAKKPKHSATTKRKAGKSEESQPSEREKKSSPVERTLEKAGSKQAISLMQNEEMKAFIFVNTDLRARIIDYQPIDFKRLHTDMKAAGLKPTFQELQDFLDDQCITYTSLEELSPRKRTKRTSRHNKT